MNGLDLVRENKLLSAAVVSLCLVIGIALPLYFSSLEREENTQCLVEPDLR